MVLKDTKTHQMRRVAFDEPTAQLLRRHRDAYAARLAMLGLSQSTRRGCSPPSPTSASLATRAR